MCGIAGFLAFGREVAVPVLETVNTAQRHRGPDDEGYLVFDAESGNASPAFGANSVVREGRALSSFSSMRRGAVLASRRLSIIDPTPAGHMPMSYGDGAFWITFNGAIYNYREIRAELEAKGHKFRTKTDTEVILASYVEWGEECLGRFNGMWAFVIVDVAKKRAFAARDRFGVKPFVYWREEGVLAFASEIKALLKFPGVQPRLHAGRAYDYLMWGILKASEETFFEGIRELPPSHALTCDLVSGEVRTRRYYALEFTREVGRFDEAEFQRHVAKVRDLVTQSVKLRLRADVPLGTSLSGGVDSSAVVATIRRLLEAEKIPQVGELQRVFTACYDDPTIDESAYAKAVVDRTQSQWFRTYPKFEEMWADFGRLVYTQDEPFGSTSIYAQYRVMKLARESGVTVALDGQGGDEVFVGYNSQYPAFFWDLLRGGRFGTFAAEWGALSNATVKPKALLRGMAEYLGARILPTSWATAAAQAVRKEGTHLNAEFVRAHQSRNVRIAERASLSLNELSHQMLTQFILPLLLRYEDRNSMAWSIESRTPFADDHPLIEYVNQVPSIYKIRHGWSKALLREAMRPDLPASVVGRRDKIGFATPQRAWLKALKKDALELLSEGDEFMRGGSVAEGYDATVANGTSREVDNIWRLLIFRKWREVFGV